MLKDRSSELWAGSNGIPPSSLAERAAHLSANASLWHRKYENHSHRNLNPSYTCACNSVSYQLNSPFEDSFQSLFICKWNGDRVVVKG